MQLKQKTSLRSALAAATCTVLSQPLHAETTAADEWDIRSGVLYYSEVDRITVIAPTVSASTVLDSGSTLTLRGLYDAITGASPNGASPTNTAQTFTSPSGEETYTAEAGETPLRDITDTRVALGLDHEMELSRLVRNTFTADFSTERDYLSIGFGDTLSRDFNNRQTTVAIGFGGSFDTIEPEGGQPRELALLSAPANGGMGGDNGDDGEDEGENKTTFNLLAGVTQVLNRRTLMQLNLTYSSSQGYLTEPYKILSVVDANTGETLDYRYEKRPDTRNSTILLWKLNYHLPQDVVYLKYRYFQDDWGIRSHTVDLKYRYELGDGPYLQPHLRHYQQSAADFYRHSLVDGETLPNHASSDLRLGEMTAQTVGVKFGIPLSHGELSLRYEQMVQKGDSSPNDAIGVQQDYDLYPTLDATIVQLGYHFRF